MGEFSRQDQLRIIDANSNRAREGIRTSEDYIRFGIGNIRWAGRLKAIRSSITQIVTGIFADAVLVGSRNAGSDPGRPANDHEGQTVSKVEASKAVAHRGLKRAQEAIRVLEEYLRGEFPSASEQMAKHRFALYDAEQWLMGSSDAFKVLSEARVYVLLTEAFCTHGLAATAEAVLKGGARVLQLREKECSDQAFLSQAHRLLRLCESYGAVLICNDRVDLALTASLPGVHLGQEDLTPRDVRRICGESIVIGRSTHSVEQAKRAVEVEYADYIAIGSMYETNTKKGRILVGVNLAEQVAALELPVPVFAIGGICEERVRELKTAGVQRIAVSTAIIQSPNPEEATRRMIGAMSA